ncbi:hypothetical protein EJ04DRAFT_565645 [Polyplosphaeria fusca]|uniref:Zn(2)-C6 fungal-type domain-containing protein n=1 Tax=Polyplosphaeria fusca TaxID=682080 RepID=A0A9P4QXW6_9PLEO|nr:hypothetical protein EJ04DRAFT_565645 [Polyplosphaeria fusca]
MATDDSRKRKAACQNCTKAKAKCSPFEDRDDVCYRCQRLGRECVYGEVVRRRAPKARSRVKQLEQRVENLIEMLTTNGQASSSLTPAPTSRHEGTTLPGFPAPTPDSADQSCETSNSATLSTDSATTPESHVSGIEEDWYDPISAGVIDRDYAQSLLDQFKDTFIWSFPFVVVSASAAVETLQREQPFLFLAIVTTMSHDRPLVQHRLTVEFKSQIASRIMIQARRSLDILQGLLVYTSCYHFHYRSDTQQLAIMIQLCVAMVQDLGLAKNPRERTRVIHHRVAQCGISIGGLGTAVERRTYLGVFYLNAAFSQAWRTRCTMVATKYMMKSARLLVEELQVPTDALILPLFRVSALTCHINDYFSYNDIEDAEVHGQTALELAAANFGGEVAQIKDSVPANLKDNPTLNLSFCVLDVWIHEFSLHRSLWDLKTSSFPPARIKALSRIMNAIKIYMATFTIIPRDTLYHFAFPTWAGWFYSIIVACKVIFLGEHERRGHADVEGIMESLDSMYVFPDKDSETRSHGSAKASDTATDSHEPSVWDALEIAKEMEITNSFERFLKTLRFSFAPGECEADLVEAKDKLAGRFDQDSLFIIACLQRSLLVGLRRKLNELKPKAVEPPSQASAQGEGPVSANNIGDIPRPIFAAGTIPFVASMNFNSLNFDGIELPDPLLSQQQQFSYDEWVWDMMMEDFTIPPM